MRVEEAIEQFLSAKLAEGRKPTTIAWYRQQLARYQQTLTGDWTDPHTIRSFLVALQADVDIYPNHPTRPPERRRLSPATLRAYHRTLKIFYTWCTAEDLISANPMRRIKAPPRPRTLPKDISAADALAILRQAQHSARDYALVLLLADTGCRDAELRGLTLPDLDLTQRRAVVTGKGSKQRHVYFCDHTAAAVTTWLQVRPTGSPWLFPNAQGAQLHKGAVYQLLRRLAAKANVTGRCNPHSFRHHFATAFLESGGDVETLRAILGHESIATTQAYAHLRTDTLRRLHDEHTPLNGMKDALIRQSKP